ncbi:hypothetical protein [Bradyrhizobium sp. OAE829]
MLNGRKNAVIGLSALLGFILLEASLAITVIVLVLKLIVGVELRFSTSD